LPEEIENLLSQVLNGKNEQERSEILDDMTDTGQSLVAMAE
jgi:hypothetical protein